MVKLYGKEMTRRDVARHTGSLHQFAGVRLMTLGDGVERGVRMLEFRSGTGLRFTVLIDRAMDIAECDHNGRAVGWQSPTGFRHPALHEYEGEGGLSWLRSFSGLLVTCGLDHTLFMNDDTADHYFYSPRDEVKSSLHGRLSTIPATLNGYGERWDGDECYLWCEGTIQQSTVFGEDLHLIRRIEIKMGSNEIKLHDRVVNHGFYRTPHMFCYHINIGHPIIAEGSRYLAPIKDTIWASHAGDDYQKQNVGYQKIPAPIRNFHEQVWQHDMVSDDETADGYGGNVPVAALNDDLNFGIEIITKKSQFPCQFEWQNFHEGHYALGIEPSTNHVLGKPFAKERDELIWLEHGEEREYETIFRILDGAEDLEKCTKRIHAIAPQPTEDYPATSGHYPPIKMPRQKD